MSPASQTSLAPSRADGEIIQFPGGLLARRGTLTLAEPRPSETSAYVSRWSGRAGPSCSALQARRRAALAAAAKRVAAEAERRALVQAIQSRADSEHWSGRQTARQAGFNQTTWRRLTRGQLNIEVWLPRLRVAARLVTAPEAAP